MEGEIIADFGLGIAELIKMLRVTSLHISDCGNTKY